MGKKVRAEVKEDASDEAEASAAVERAWSGKDGERKKAKRKAACVEKEACEEVLKTKPAKTVAQIVEGDSDSDDAPPEVSNNKPVKQKEQKRVSAFVIKGAAGPKTISFEEELDDSDDADGSAKKKKDRIPAVVDEAEVKRKTQKAIKEVLRGIQFSESKETFAINNWNTKYKKVLGTYKKFLLKHPDIFKVTNDVGSQGVLGFTIKKVEGAEKEIGVVMWRRMLNTAWNTYCQAVPKDKRNFSTFASVLPKQYVGTDGKNPRGKRSGKKHEGLKKTRAGDKDNKAPKDEETSVAVPPKKKKNKADETPTE